MISSPLAVLTVLTGVAAAFLFYRVTDEAGAVSVLGEALPHLTADKGMQALVIGWGFASFLQGVGGFGVPVAVVAPILVGLGFAPIAAIIIQLTAHLLGLGSCWAQIRSRAHDDRTSAEAYVQGLLGLPEHIRVESIIGIGHPDEVKNPLPAAKLRYGKIHSNHW